MNKNKLNEKINKLKAGANFEKVGKSLGLNSLESEVLEYNVMNLLTIADESWGNYCINNSTEYDDYLASIKNFAEECKNIKVPYIIDNTDYSLEEEEADLLDADGYMIVNDLRYFDPEECSHNNHYQTYDIDLSKMIDFNTIEKYIHLLTVNPSVAGNQWRAMEKLAQKKNMDNFTTGMLLKWLDY